MWLTSKLCIFNVGNSISFKIYLYWWNTITIIISTAYSVRFQATKPTDISLEILYNQWSEKEIKKTLSSTTSKRLKYQLNLTKVKDLYTENYKTPVKGIKLTQKIGRCAGSLNEWILLRNPYTQRNVYQGLNGIFKSILFLLIMCACVCVSVCHMCVVAPGGQKMVPWIWSYR